jgi:hypothetical protein
MPHRAIDTFKIDANRRGTATLTGRGDYHWKTGLDEVLASSPPDEPFTYSTNENANVIIVEGVPLGRQDGARKRLNGIMREANRRADKSRSQG